MVAALLVLPASPALAATTITIDGTKAGRTFDGVGAVSGGGGNSKLLFDYPEPQRSQVLDYLFKPGVGAAVQLFKVEIGGDANSTDGAEPSHMHTRTDEDYTRGYEWWLMEQAKARNPNVKLAALAWAAPGWIGNGNFWTQDMIDYIVKWIKGAKTFHNLTIDYIGGWNENGWDTTWFVNLKNALVSNGLSTKVVGADNGFDVVNDMVSNTAFRNAVDVVGAHYPCDGANGGSATAFSCSSPANAQSIGKPLWASENGSQDFNAGADRMARQLVLGYVDAKMTAYINWPLIAALPPGLPWETMGLAVASQPWSGGYAIGKQAWVMAQVTQFTQVGWKFIDSASGLLGGNRANGSYMTLQAPDHSGYSTVIETTRATTAQTFTASVTGGLPTSQVHVWATNLKGADLVHTTDVTPSNGSFTVTLQPGYVYTLSTTTGQGKGTATSPASGNFPLPYQDNFDSYAVGREARFIADEDGSFEVANCAGGRAGRCVRQMAPRAPIYWHGHAGYPWTLVGDNSWSNYTVSTDVLFEQTGSSASVIGRYGARDYWEIGHINAYYVQLTDAGRWSILKNTTGGTQTTLASGTVAAPGTNTWHNVAATFQGATITAKIDGVTVGSANDGSYGLGPAGLASGVSDGTWKNVQYDNLAVTPGGANPRYKLLNRNSGKALAVNGGSTADGATIVQSTDNGSASQQWQLVGSSLVNVGSGKALDNPGFSTNQGTQLVQWTSNGGTNQQWTLTASGGFYTLTNVFSGMLADVSGASTADGAPVIQWPSNGGTNQQWSLVQV